MKTLNSVFIEGIKPFYTYENLYYFPKKSIDEINTFADIMNHHTDCSRVIYLIDKIHIAINNVYVTLYPINVNKFEIFVKSIFNPFEEIKHAFQFMDKLYLVKNILDNPEQYGIITSVKL